MSAEERSKAVIDAARTLALHWFDQDGFGSDVVDALLVAVVEYDTAIEREPVPPGLLQPDTINLARALYWRDKLKAKGV